MNIPRVLKSAILVFAASLTTLSFPVSAHNSAKRPDNLAKAYTFVSSRAFDSVDGTFFLDGMIDGDGMDFFKNTMGYSDEEIEENREEAIAFFQERFGIDVDDPRVYFTGFQIDPAADYRVVMVSGRTEHPRNGYPIVDGGWAVAVIDPDGLDLGAEFAGTHVPPGTMFTHGGSYVIKRGPWRSDVVISYQSRGPMQPVGTGGVLNCEVVHPRFGEGVAWGYFEIHELPNGQLSAQVRNVLTFPAFGLEEQLINDEADFGFFSERPDFEHELSED